MKTLHTVKQKTTVRRVLGGENTLNSNIYIYMYAYKQMDYIFLQTWHCINSSDKLLTCSSKAIMCFSDILTLGKKRGNSFHYFGAVPGSGYITCSSGQAKLCSGNASTTFSKFL